jgi:hypothetical protein
MNPNEEAEKKIKAAALEQARRKRHEADIKQDARLYDQAADFYDLAEQPQAAATCRNAADKIRGV